MDRSALNLEDPDCLPAELLDQLRSCDELLESSQHLEGLISEPSIDHALTAINDFCLRNKIVGYHYTRAIADDILTSGLQPRTGDEIRRGFTERFGYLFTNIQLAEIQRCWSEYYTPPMQHSRDGRIYFNFTRKALGTGGSELLLGLYGGEQIYFAIDHLPGVHEILSSLGEPLIVKCSLSPSNIATYIDRPWAQIVVSSYHRRLNPQAIQIDQDGTQSVAVGPNDIELHRLEH